MIIAFYFLSIGNIAGQKWEIVYDDTPSMGRHIENTNDLCYIATGLNSQFDQGITLKIDTLGNIIWVKPYGGNCIKQTKDNGFIIARGENYIKAILRKLDNRGNSIWVKTFGGSGQDEFYSVVQTSDNGFMACGFSNSYGDSSVFVVKTDNMGNLLWQRSLCSSNFALARDIIKIGNYYYIVGKVKDEYSYYKLLILKLDIHGNLIWQKIHDVGFTGESIIHTTDNNLIVAGGIILTKLNLNGDTIWRKVLYPTLKIFSIKQTPDHGFILSGNYNYCDQINMIAKTDSVGNILWTKLYPTGLYGYMDNFVSIQTTNDNGYIACGYSEYNSAYKLRIIKTDSIGDYIVGFNITASDDEFSIYPNPANKNIIIESNELTKPETISIYNLQGQLILQQTIKQTKTTINIENFARGIYIIKLTDNANTITSRIVKE